MQLALRGLPSSKFVQPDDKTIRGNVKDLPYLKGMTPVDATAKLLSMGFKAAISPTPVDSDAPAGTVAYHHATAGGRCARGATVTLVLLQRQQGAADRPHTADHPAAAGTPPTIKPPPGFPSCPPWDPKYPKCGRGGR
jgi:hypothetical protein